MAMLFSLITQDEIRKDFTNLGFIHGWVPVYIGGLDEDMPLVAVRNGFPGWLEPVGRHLWLLAEWVLLHTVPGFEPPDGWKLSIGEPINKALS